MPVTPTDSPWVALPADQGWRWGPHPHHQARLGIICLLARFLLLGFGFHHAHYVHHRNPLCALTLFTATSPKVGFPCQLATTHTCALEDPSYAFPLLNHRNGPFPLTCLSICPNFQHLPQKSLVCLFVIKPHKHQTPSTCAEEAHGFSRIFHLVYADVM